MRPLAVNLRQPKLVLAANAAIKKLVACWAQNPHHVGLSIAGQAPCSISSKFWSMRNFKNATFTAGLTRTWHVRISSPKPVQGNIFELARSLISWPANFVFTSRPRLSQIARRFNRALTRTISLIRVGRFYRKMRLATGTITSVIGRPFVLRSSEPPSALGAIIAAPFAIWSNGLEWLETLAAR